MDETTSLGAELISRERARQVHGEGWSAEHDDKHAHGELALAAVAYAAPVRMYAMRETACGIAFVDPWPDQWDPRWDKRFRYGERRENPGNHPPEPRTYTHDERVDLLVKAGALIAAEIDRLERAKSRTPAGV